MAKPLDNSNGNGIIETEKRANPYHDTNTEQFTFLSIKIPIKERIRLGHQILTDFPNLKPDGTFHPYENRNHFYIFRVEDTGSYSFWARIKIDGNEEYISAITEIVRKSLVNIK